METTLIQILTQVIENGKEKGSFTFNLNLDSDILDHAFLYEKEKAIEVIEQMLSIHSNNHTQYKFISYEILFHNPVELCTSEQFSTALEKLLLKESN